MPELSEEQRAVLPKNVITRALGMQDQVMVDLLSDDPELGDIYLLCSDGLSGMIPDDEILRIVTTSTDPSDMCRKLIAKANQNGGEDNITVLAIKFTEPKAEGDATTVPTIPPEAPPSSRRSRGSASTAKE
jgi:protein phosphatase